MVSVTFGRTHGSGGFGQPRHGGDSVSVVVMPF